MLPRPPRLDPGIAATLPPYATDPLGFLTRVAAQGDVVAYRFGADFEAFTDTLLDTLRASQVAIDAAMAGRFDRAERAALDRATADLDVIVQRMVAERTVGPTTGRDLLAVLVEALASGDPAFG